MKRNVVALDLETTGTDPRRDRIVELALVRVDEAWCAAETFHTLVDPGCPIPEEAASIHGIRDDDVRGQPTFKEVAHTAAGWLRGATVVAYNHGFDVPFLHEELLRTRGTGLPTPTLALDPLPVFRRHHPDGPNKLEDAVRHYGTAPLEHAHSALADTLATVDVLRAQLRDPDTWPHRVDAALLAHDPSSGRFTWTDPPGPVTDAQGRTWLDPACRLYRDPEGVVRLGFGKHKGRPALAETAYLEWMLGRDFEADTLRVVRDLLHTLHAR